MAVDNGAPSRKGHERHERHGDGARWVACIRPCSGRRNDFLVQPRRSHRVLTFEDVVAIAVQDPAEGVPTLTYEEYPLDLCISPDGNYLYVLLYYSKGIFTYARDNVTGALTLVQTLKNGEEGLTGLTSPECMAVSPDGKNLYVNGSGSNSVHIFNRDDSTDC